MLGRRPDGYHELDSRVVFASIGDEIRLAGAPGTLTIDGPFAMALDGDGDGDGDNLVLRAAHALAESLGRSLGVGFRLTKRLPVAAGLGGGSSDAAAVLRLLGRQWDCPQDRLMAVAASLGADVPVCLLRRAVRMSGIGETLELLPQAERARLSGLPILLVNPGVPAPTGAVFGALAAGDAGAASTLMDGLEAGGPARSVNDLLAPALRVQPAIGEVLSTLAGAAGCIGHGMSGSGPSGFALFSRMTDCAALAQRVKHERPAWWVASARVL